jgi:hypothetical protein
VEVCATPKRCATTPAVTANPAREAEFTNSLREIPFIDPIIPL